MIVGLIPARSGSKGIPGKNLIDCGGKPLIHHTIEAAQASTQLDQLIISTDDVAIMDYARKCGVSVPFQRPSELADDATPMLSVLQHALAWIRANSEEPEAIVLLQPTSPLRKARHIDDCIRLWKTSKAATVVSVKPVPHEYSPESLMALDDSILLPMSTSTRAVTRRQDKPKLYARNGPAILVLSPHVIDAGILYGNPTRGYIMELGESIDIDSLYDLKLAEFLMSSD